MKKNKKLFKTSDGTKLDILYRSSVANPIAIFLIYPCVAGTSRAYLVPHEELLSQGFSVLEYHPRIHGKSGGQMAMEVGIKDLYEYLIRNNLHNIPIIALGHSAGCNALLQLNTSFLNVIYYYFVQPVFCFRESMDYMYKVNSYHEFITVLSRWAIDKDKLNDILSDPSWFNPRQWHEKNIKNSLDSISEGLKIGTFLENFYIPGFSTSNHMNLIKDKSELIISEKDSWYPVQTTKDISKKYSIPLTVVSEASDHYFSGAWEIVWDRIMYQLPKCLDNLNQYNSSPI